MQAMEKLRGALKLDPASAIAKQNISVSANNLAIKAEQANDEKLAKSYFHQALYYDPASDLVRTNLNNLLKSQGHDPLAFAVRTQLAEHYAKVNDLLDAVVEYQEAVRLKKDAQAERRLNDLQRQYQLQSK